MRSAAQVGKETTGALGGLRTLVLALTGLIALSACGLGSPSTSTTPQPSRSPSASPKVDHCANLAKRGITPCPPANLPLDKVPIINKTDGKVPDTQVARDGLAVVRAFGLYRWAYVNNHADFLRSDALSRPAWAESQGFRPELDDLDAAHQAGGRLEVQSLKLASLALVPLTAQVTGDAQRAGYLVSPYEWVQTFSGPASTVLVTPDGRTKNLRVLAASDRLITLSFGEVRDDADLGRIWYETGNYDCLAYPTREACRL